MEKQIKKLIEYFTKMQFTDIIGFGQILEVEEVDEFADYVTSIIEAFSKQDRTKRRQLLKLAKDISKANKHMVAKGEGVSQAENSEKGTTQDIDQEIIDSPAQEDKSKGEK